MACACENRRDAASCDNIERVETRVRNVLTHGQRRICICTATDMYSHRHIYTCTVTDPYIPVQTHAQPDTVMRLWPWAVCQDIAHSRLNSFNVVATCRISSILTRTCHLPPQMTQTSFQIKCQVDLAISSRLGSDANSTRDGKQSWQDPSRLDIGANVKSTWVQC